MQPENPKQKPQGKTPGKLERWLKAREWKKETHIRDLSKKHSWIMKPSKEAIEAAIELMKQLEDAGYLDFDGGEQEERAEWLKRFEQSFQSAIEKGMQAWRDGGYDHDTAAQPQPRKCPDCKQELTGDEMIDREVHGRCSSQDAASSKPEWPDVIGSGGQSPSEASSEHCPGPRQHGHPLVYESHCDHGETQPHEIAASSEPQDAEAKLLSKINKAVRDKDATAFLAAIESSSSEPRKWTVDEENKQLIAPTGERFSVGFASMDSYPLAKLINAALADLQTDLALATQMCDIEGKRANEAEAALAAEREAWRHKLQESVRVNMLTEKQLADERELREQENDGAVKIIAALNAKLLAAQAAMEWAAKVLDLGESVQAEEILLNALASVKEQP